MTFEVIADKVRCSLDTIGLQIQRNLAGNVNVNSNVVFDTVINSYGDIFYDSITGATGPTGLTGIYQISASLDSILDNGESAVFTIFSNILGALSPPFSSVYAPVSAGNVLVRTGVTIQYSLSAGDKISIQPTAETGTVNYRSASLTFIRIQ